MAMSDCIKCWETPCICGHEYKDWSRDKKLKLAATILGLEERDLEKVTDSLLEEQYPIEYF